MQLTQRDRLISSLLGAACILVLALHSLFWFPEVIDDAYISFQYSKNLTLGKGLVFNEGERLEGYSNFLYVLLMAPVVGLRMDVVLWAKILGIACGALTLAAGLFYIQRFLSARGLATALFGFLLASNACFVYATVSGLETALFALLCFLTVYRYAVEMESPLHPWSALLFAACFLTRPDGVIIALPLILLRIVALRRGIRPFAARDIQFMLVVVFIAILYAAFKLWYFGSLLPNTFLAKVSSKDLRFWRERGAWYVVNFFRKQPAFSVLCIAGTIALFLRSPRRWHLRVIGAGGGLIAFPAFSYYANGDWMPNYRFMVPSIPFLALIVAAGVDGVLGNTCFGFRKRQVFRWMTVLLLCAAALEGFSISKIGEYAVSETIRKEPAPWARRILRPTGSGFSAGPHRFAAWIAVNVPVGCSVELPDLGLPAYANRARFIDNHGLVSRIFARVSQDSPDFQQVYYDFLEATPPDFVFVYTRKKKLDSPSDAHFPWAEYFLSHPIFKSNYTQADMMCGSSRCTYIFRRVEIPSDESVERKLDRLDYAIRYNPRVLVFYTTRYDLLHEAHRYREASETLMDAMERFPDSPEVWRTASFWFREQRMYEEYEACLERALHLRPHEVFRQVDLVYCYVRLNKLKEAARLIDNLEAHNLLPDQILSISAEVMEKLGRLEKAREFRKRLQSLGEPDDD